ncbi:MAG: tetratricopeptide repeat protein [Deltaproteobacteria bacterium]|nr:tetratricopeptide repeat protein [Deltaproteobacteria bacterium]
MTSGTSARAKYLSAALVVALVCALFAPVRHFDFLSFDDPEYVSENPHVQAGLTKETFQWAFSEAHSGHYHPLTWLSHALDIQLFGLNPGWHHVINVAIHALSALLLYFFVLRLLAPNDREVRSTSVGPALICALIFGLHPLRLESVAWISERKDVLSVFFALLALHAYVSFARHRTLVNSLAVMVCLLCGLLAKPMLVSLPVLFLVCDYWPLDRLRVASAGVSSFRNRIVEKLPFFALSGVFCVVALSAQASGGGLRSMAESDLSNRIAVAFTATLAYAGKLYWPTGFGIFYPHQMLTPGIGAGSALGLIAISGWCWALRNRYPSLLFGWLWFTIAILPVCGLVQIGGQLLADRWTYLPHVGLILGTVVFVRDYLTDSFPKLNRVVIAALPVVACFVITARELPHWRNGEAIHRRTLAVSPNNFMAHTNLSFDLLKRGELAEAKVHALEAVRLNPTYPEALNNLGTVHGQLGEYREALPHFQKALEIRPNFSAARHNLQLTLVHLGRNS